MFGDRIGEGTFGLVYKANWRGSPVAVKMLKMQNITEHALQEFRKELQILTYVRGEGEERGQKGRGEEAPLMLIQEVASPEYSFTDGRFYYSAKLDFCYW